MERPKPALGLPERTVVLSAATAMRLAQRPIRRTRVEAFHFLGIFMLPPFPKCAVLEWRHRATPLLGDGPDARVGSAGDYGCQRRGSSPASRTPPRPSPNPSK